MAQPLSPTEQTDTEEVPIPLHEAYAACEAIVRSHYENFPVASRFLTPARRSSLAAIYAFARRADDVADAAAPTRERLEAIDRIEVTLHRAVDGAPSGPIFVALADSVERFRLPVEPLLDLLSAFRQDARDETFSTWDDLLVLALHDIEDADALRESDAICTALQLTNFWQDLGGDLTRGRLFLPLEDLRRFGLTREDLARPAQRGLLTRLLVHECRATNELYERGRPIVRRVPFGLSLQLRLTIAGGRTVLRQVERSGWRVLRNRPTLGGPARARILLTSLLGFDA
jgi:squalene synthase HpnC